MYGFSLRLLFLLFLAFPFVRAQDVLQNGPAPDGKTGTSVLTATGVAPDDVVISIVGVCDRELLVEGTAQGTATSKPAGSGNGGQNDPECKTEVTRAEFERLIDSLDPNMSRSNRIRTAVRYPELLAAAARARELSIDKSPRFQEKVKHNYLQLLSQAYDVYAADKASNMSDADVQKYYSEHPEAFEQLELLRIFVPKEKAHSEVPSSPAKLAQVRAADETAMKAEAEQIRTKALAGGDFEKLEAEAYKFAGKDVDEAPDVDLGKVTRAEVPGDYQKGVFGLKVGQISEVIPAPQGWHICKVLSRQQIPLTDARPLLTHLRVKDTMESLKKSVKTQFSDAYFNISTGMDPAKSAEAESR